LLIVSCEQPSGIQVPKGRFTSLEALGSYLITKPENTPETPYPIALSAVDLSSSLNPLFAAFRSRYVSLDLSACVLREIPAEQNIAARENKDRLVSLTLPSALQSIGAYAFYQSSSLTTLTLPDTLRDIGDSAFAECGIEEMELPARLQSLGDCGGYVVFGFDHSVEKRPTGGELYIKGNAPEPPKSANDEPGVVWVMQDSNGNGKPDDVWYELRGEAYSQNYNIHRYAVTWFRPYIKGGTSYGSWVDNRGKSGTHYSANFPFSVKGASVTFVLSHLEYLLDYSAGYVDIYKCDTFSIADAVQADGSPIDLAYIDFVKVQSACFNPYKGEDLSTELAAPEDASMPADTAVRGMALGAGMYRYRLVNESQSALTVTVQDYGPVYLGPGESRDLDLAFQRRFWKLGGSGQRVEVGVGILTFYD
jgi:hypothetical protein